MYFFKSNHNRAESRANSIAILTSHKSEFKPAQEFLYNSLSVGRSFTWFGS